MAKFFFKLKTLLNLKRQIEEQAKYRLAETIAARDRALLALREIERTIAATIAEFRVLSGGRFAAGRMKVYNDFIAKMKDRAAAQKRVVAEAERHVAAARSALLEAAQQRKMYEKLREKEYIRYLEAEKHTEQQLVDERISYQIGSGSHGEENETDQRKGAQG